MTGREREIAAHLNTRARGGMAVVSGGKRALLVGVSYKGDTSRELTGAAEDVKNMNSLLKKFLFPEESIHMLTGN
jgi:hypothetical protein